MADKGKKNKRYDRYFQHNQRYLRNLLRNYFIWEGLPETIDARALNEIVLFKGSGVGFRVGNEALDDFAKNQIVFSEGALAGIDLYQRPVTFISSNPRISPSVHRKPLVDCVPCYNTLNYQFGETCNPLVDIYADLLANTLISFRSSVRNSKVILVPTVADDTEAIRIAEALEDMYDGESYVLNYEIGDLSGNNLFPIKAKDAIVTAELADAKRSIMADFFQETGVQTIPVDKKERVNLLEMSSNDTQTKIACDIMLKPRELWAKQMNDIFGTSISVKFNEEVIKNEMYKPQSMENTDNDQ